LRTIDNDVMVEHARHLVATFSLCLGSSPRLEAATALKPAEEEALASRSHADVVAVAFPSFRVLGSLDVVGVAEAGEVLEQRTVGGL
jgi:hypothetical protein